MSGLLNLGSLIFGLAAWILPILSLMRQNKVLREKWAILSTTSVGACALSLCLQIFELNHRIKIQDWAALLDTSQAVAAVSVLLLAVTIILNAVVLSVFQGHPKD